MNCVANGKLVKENIFKKIWIQPASGDAGGSLGAALSVYYLMLNNFRSVKSNEDSMQGSFLGPSYENNEVEKILIKNNANYTKLTKENLLNSLNDILNKKNASKLKVDYSNTQKMLALNEGSPSKDIANFILKTI